MATNEIDIIFLVNKVLKAKKTLLVFVIISIILGVGYALGQQKTYTASVIIAPEANSMGMSQSISDIAGAIGMSLGNNNQGVDAIYPEIYPEIFASNDFIIKMFDIPVKTKRGVKTYYNHILQDSETPYYKKPFALLMSLFNTEKAAGKSNHINPFQLTKQQDMVCGAIRGNIDCQMSKGNSLIYISVQDVDPYIAACLADTLQRRLQEYITLYRTQKARQDLAYAQKLNDEAKRQYEKARQQYTAFSDANTDIMLVSFQAKREDLENDMQLKYNNYTSTKQQIQQAHDKIKENTPAFTIIQQASVPLKASSTPKSIIVIMFVLFGVFADLGWILLIRDNINKLNFK